jgi:hypothetical protein
MSTASRKNPGKMKELRKDADPRRRAIGLLEDQRERLIQLVAEIDKALDSLFLVTKFRGKNKKT